MAESRWLRFGEDSGWSRGRQAAARPRLTAPHGTALRKTRSTSASTTSKDLHEQEGDLDTALIGLGQSMSMIVLDRIGALAFHRTCNVDIFCRAAACLTGALTDEFWYTGLIDENDIYSTTRGLSTIDDIMPDAQLHGFETEDP
jgi:hypothetical protein